MITPVLSHELILMSRAKKIGAEFFKECNVPGNFSYLVWYRTWLQLLSKNIGVMWKIEKDGVLHGALGGILAPDANDGELCAYEGFWYVTPQYRAAVWTCRLLDTFEKWAIEMQCKRVHLAHLVLPNSSKFDKFIQKRGFQVKEILYVKDL